MRALSKKWDFCNNKENANRFRSPLMPMGSGHIVKSAEINRRKK